MAVETAADLAGFFDEEEFAEAAIYSPPGGGDEASCLVIVDRGQGRGVFAGGRERGSFDGGGNMVGSERHLWVRRAEVAEVQRAGTFTILDAAGDPTDEVFEVAGLPKLDHTASLWSADLLIGSAL